MINNVFVRLTIGRYTYINTSIHNAKNKDTEAPSFTLQTSLQEFAARMTGDAVRASAVTGLNSDVVCCVFSSSAVKGEEADIGDCSVVTKGRAAVVVDDDPVTDEGVIVSTLVVRVDEVETDDTFVRRLEEKIVSLDNPCVVNGEVGDEDLTSVECSVVRLVEDVASVKLCVYAVVKDVVSVDDSEVM